ncbi:hypothetical protein [Microbispora sp. NPDC046933]|uniref:hypothetical protein n=1 Tax=Microbispora sp. NPDC046933 TaxID=3155618 RepID=UPI0033CEA040
MRNHNWRMRIGRRRLDLGAVRDAAFARVSGTPEEELRREPASLEPLRLLVGRDHPCSPPCHRQHRHPVPGRLVGFVADRFRPFDPGRRRLPHPGRAAFTAS